MSNIKEVAQKYSCECCTYTTNKKSNYSRHMVSKKHQKKMNGEETSSIEEEKSKTRKPRTPKIKKNTEELSIQTDSDDETVYSDFTIECQSDNEIDDNVKQIYENQIKELREMYEKQINELKEENEILKDNVELLQQEKEELQQEIELTNEEILKNDAELEIFKNNFEIIKYQKIVLEEKIIYGLKCQIQDAMEIIEEKKMIEKFNTINKFQQPKQEETNDEIIINLRIQIEKIQEFIYDNVESAKPAIKMIIEEQPILKCINDENNYLTKENFESLNKENLLLTDEVIKLEEELNSLKCEISNLNIKKYTSDEIVNDKKKKSKKIKNDNSKNPMEIYKELCRDSKFNNKIISNSFIDKSNKCEIVKMNIMKSINSEDHQIKPSKIYQEIFISVIEEMNSKNIKFIECVDTRRNKFKIHDGTEWKKYNEHEFEDIIKILMNHISNSFYNAISNTTEMIDNIEFMKIYKKSKEYFLSEEGSKNEIILSILNPLYDDNLNFMKTVIILCKKMCKDTERKNNISRKSCKKSSKKKYESETDDDSDDDDSDSD